MGNLESYKNGLDQQTFFAYDPLQRVKKKTRISAQDDLVMDYTHGVHNNITGVTDSNGNSISSSYDELNRLQSSHYPEGSQDTSFTYDQGTNGTGKLTGVTDSSGGISYQYNIFGQVKRRTILDLKIDKGGKPTPQSLSNLYDYLSKNLGKGQPVRADYYSDADYQKIVDFATQRMNDPNRDPYSWTLLIQTIVNPLRTRLLMLGVELFSLRTLLIVLVFSIVVNVFLFYRLFNTAMSLEYSRSEQAVLRKRASDALAVINDMSTGMPKEHVLSFTSVLSKRGVIAAKSNLLKYK